MPGESKRLKPGTKFTAKFLKDKTARLINVPHTHKCVWVAETSESEFVGLDETPAICISHGNKSVGRVYGTFYWQPEDIGTILTVQDLIKELKHA